MESPTNPLMSSLTERTAISCAIQSIFNHLLLPYAQLFNTKWIEVNSEFTDSTKLDGLSTMKGSEEILLIIEFAGGNMTSSTAKLDSDIKKIYVNALKSIKESKRSKVFTAFYFNNSIYYEVLLQYQQQYVRYNNSSRYCLGIQNQNMAILDNIVIIDDIKKVSKVREKTKVFRSPEEGAQAAYNKKLQDEAKAKDEYCHTHMTNIF